jgi:hypothetical protein
MGKLSSDHPKKTKLVCPFLNKNNRADRERIAVSATIQQQ